MCVLCVYMCTRVGQKTNVDCATNEASTHFECSTTAAVKKGEQLLVPYGTEGMSNGQLLMDYGLTFKKNKRDRSLQLHYRQDLIDHTHHAEKHIDTRADMNKDTHTHTHTNTHPQRLCVST